MSLFGLGSRNQKTFRPKKSAPSGSKGAQVQKHIDATLGSGNLREAVKLPPGEDINEWLAVNRAIPERLLCCPPDTFCYSFWHVSKMNNHFRNWTFYNRWADGITIKKLIEVSAPKYVEYLMD